MKLFGKTAYIGAAVAAGVAGTVLYRRSRSRRGQSALARAARITAAAIAGRRMFFGLFKRLVKQNFLLRVCHMRLHRMEEQQNLRPQQEQSA